MSDINTTSDQLVITTTASVGPSQTQMVQAISALVNGCPDCVVPLDEAYISATIPNWVVAYSLPADTLPNRGSLASMGASSPPPKYLLNKAEPDLFPLLGCICMNPVSNQVVEMRSMVVKPAVRPMGIALKMRRELERRARERDFSEIVFRRVLRRKPEVTRHYHAILSEEGTWSTYRRVDVCDWAYAHEFKTPIACACEPGKWIFPFGTSPSFGPPNLAIPGRDESAGRVELSEPAYVSFRMQ